MAKTALKKEKWNLSFDPRLKNMLIKEAKKKGIYPVSLLEQIVRERFNPYGHSDIKESVTYLKKIRQGSRSLSDDAFLKEIREWQRSSS